MSNTHEETSPLLVQALLPDVDDDVYGAGRASPYGAGRASPYGGSGSSGSDVDIPGRLTATPVNVDFASWDDYGTTEWMAIKKDVPPWKPPGANKASLLASVFTSWNVTIGVGILALPRAFARVGMVPASIGMFCCAMLCMCTFMMLSRAMRETGHYTFGGVMRATSGRWGSIGTDFIICAFLYGVLIVYTQVGRRPDDDAPHGSRARRRLPRADRMLTTLAVC